MTCYPPSRTSTQGRLRCTQHYWPLRGQYRHAGSPPSRRACGPTNLGLHGSRVNAHMPLWIAPQP